MNFEISPTSTLDLNLNKNTSESIGLESMVLSPGGMIRCLDVDPSIGEPPEMKGHLSPDLAIEMLYEGNRRFAQHKTIHPHQNSFRLDEVANGQNPFATILGCADSRVPVEVVFDRGLGDLFVIRNAGNIVTDTAGGSVEYGAFVLGTKVILVLGHSRCGAIRGAIKNIPLPGQINSILNLVKPAVDSTVDLPGDRVTNAVIANIRNQIDLLKSSKVLSELIAMGELKIVGGFYDLDTGVVIPV
jgi:carbonic anhydrase